jgi:hypothetical protein
MTNDQLEHECREWLLRNTIGSASWQDTALATFIRQREDKARDEERKRCVEVLVEETKHRLSSSPISINGDYHKDYYTRLLSVEANTEEGKVKG